MWANLVLILICCCFAVKGSPGGIGPAPASLRLFMPFDEISSTRDIANDDDIELTDISDAKLMASINGPFGLPKTSYTVKTSLSQIGELKDFTLSPAFTTAFYFYTEANQTGAMLQFQIQLCDYRRLNIMYEGPNYLKVVQNSDGFTAKFSMLTAKKWNFVAITYENEDKLLTVFNEKGKMVGSAVLPDALFDDGYLRADIDVGNAYAEEVKMKETDAIACLTIHDIALTGAQIAQLPEQCRTKGRRTPYSLSESMLGVWLFDSKAGTRSLVDGFPLRQTANTELATSGPFGVNGTSYSPKKDGTYLGVDQDISLTSAFTLSFYLYSEVKGNGAIVSFPIFSNNVPNGLAVNYLEPDLLEIWGGVDEAVKDTKAPSYKLIGRFPVLTPNNWTLVVLTYDLTTRNLTVSGSKTDSVLADLPVNSTGVDSLNGAMYVGYSTFAYDKELFMNRTDAIACLMLDSKVLTAAEIANISDICKKEAVGTTGASEVTETTSSSNTSDDTLVLRKSMLAFFPFDEKTKTRDLLYSKEFSLADQSKVTMGNGPHGVEKTAYTLTEDGEFGSCLFHMVKHDDPITEFTISLYFYTQLNAKGAIFHFTFSAEFSIDLLYDKPTNLEIYQNYQLIGRFPILKANSWNFLALTYDMKTQQLAIYDETGKKVAIALADGGTRGSDWLDATLHLGKGNTSAETGFTMKANDALSCLTFAKRVLSPSQISSIPQLYCKSKGRYNGTWPQPDQLIGYWPFDNQWESWDIVRGLPSVTSTLNDVPKLVTNLPGPFADQNTSYSVLCEGRLVGEHSFRFDETPTTMFTISFYFYTEAKGQGAIYAHQPFFELTYKEPDILEVWDNSSGHHLLGNFSVIKASSWKFLALGYNETSQQLIIFDENGTNIASMTANFKTNSTWEFYIGPTYRPAEYLWKTTDAISCLMVYNTALTPSQIAELPQVCRTKGAASPTTLAPETSPPPTTTTPGTTTAPTTTAPAPTTTESVQTTPTTQTTLTSTTAVPSTSTTTAQESTTTTAGTTRAPTTTRTPTQSTKTDTKTSTTTKPKSTPWPRPDALLGFWPLFGIWPVYKLDIGPNTFLPALGDGPAKTDDGPFGDRWGSVSPRHNGDQILEVVDDRLAVMGSFTVSLFLSRGIGKGSGGLFEFRDRLGSQQAFQIGYINETAIEVIANGETIGHYNMIQPKGAWTFMAFTFDAPRFRFTVYGRHGIISPPSDKPSVAASMQYNNYGMRLGNTTRFSEGFRTVDSITCLMIYSAALSPQEIRRLFSVCRYVHDAPPCGAPKIPELPPIVTNPVIRYPVAGMFPHIAVIRFGTSICSASILDQFWLLTSIQCFKESADPSRYTVYVGAHDLDVNELHRVKHSVHSIITSGPTQRGIALVQLDEPIDFTNLYVNDACLFTGDSFDEVRLDDTKLVFGWGKNGRPSTMSDTLPRYVPGPSLPFEECMLAWGLGNYAYGFDICFMTSCPHKDVPCSGDEGSPLLAQAHSNEAKGLEQRLVQIGVYYKRDANCSTDKPALFADVLPQIDWISQTIACAIPGASYPTNCPQEYTDAGNMPKISSFLQLSVLALISLLRFSLF